ncbi:GNAT family N-acetyltransferase [Agrobacterium tumefaciens]|uniref:GNAT family N-acetyltransferase n=1 Tax=Agrobacterium tumefaciens TaxID=358 RepID=UPI003B9DDB8E
MELEPEKIKALWQALQAPVPMSSVIPSSIEDSLIESGWISDTEFEDILFALDRRIDPPHIVDPAEIAIMLDIPQRNVYPRPQRRTDDVTGYRRIAATDAAALLIWLERLGFRIDVSSLCNRLKHGLEGQSYLTEEEISVLFYDGNRHRMAPVTVVAPHRPWRGMKTVKFRTEAGYRIEYKTDDDGVSISLSVYAPRYRKPPPTQIVTCPSCTMDYIKGSPLDEREHRRSHRRWSAVVNPKPHRKLTEAIQRDLDAVWVDADSPKWKRQEVYERSRLFRREFGYDFVQWSVEHDPDAIGFLFADEEGRIVGACSFRTQPEWNGRRWRLYWIWLCPSARRSGRLGHQWERFTQRFGIFDIEPPVSEAMKAFLIKNGCSDLIT